MLPHGHVRQVACGSAISQFRSATGRFGSGVSREIGGPDDDLVPEAVFGLDFLRYSFSPTTYRYVSYGTYWFYIMSFVASFLLFLSTITAFLADRLLSELFYLFLLFFVALGTSIAMQRTKA